VPRALAASFRDLRPHADVGIDAALLEHVPAAIVVSDALDRVVYCNRSARQLHACAAGGPLPPELALAVRKREQWEGEVRVAGRRFHCAVAPVRDGGENLVATISVSLVHGPGREDPELRELGRRIARARAAARLTQQQLAERLGVTRRSVQGYEAGAVAPYRHLERLAEVLECPEISHPLRLR
jgi:DNA-binding XRE family transcriptional regulator